jgi:AraC-like DNA-binding protein
MPSTAIHARSAPEFPAGFSPERPEQFTVTCDQSPLGFGAEVPGDIRCKLTNRAQLVAASRLAVSLNYMVTHLDQPMRVSTLSAMAGLSMSRFFELFKSATGDAPINWLIRVRMQRAGELLENSNLRIKEIALRVGYDDQFYFSRLFKLVHGIAPSAYRVQRETAKAHQESNPHILPFRGESL